MRQVITKTKKYFEEEFKLKYIDGKFYQDKPRAGLVELKPYIIEKKHPYGRTIKYEYLTIYNYITHKFALFSYHSIVYAWFKGDIPAGYDVDHIDGDTLNNNPDNLQILSRKENLAKRTGNRVNRRIYCIELNKEYNSITSAIEELGISPWYMMQTLKGNNPKKAKYHFRYIGEKV